MNWTEGTLNRHSRGRKGKETILRQKQYFAKARSGLLNANVQKSPPSISFLAHPSLSSPLTRFTSGRPTSSSPKRRSDALESSRYFSGLQSKLPSPATFQRQQTEEEALRQKQRKLLLKGDWVGTDIQKPIDMRFSKQQASTSNAWGARLARHESSRARLRQLLGVKHEDGRSKAHQSGLKSSNPNSFGKIRIRVGSRERTLGTSSNTGRSHRGQAPSSHGSHEAGLNNHRGAWRTQDNVSIPGSGTRTHQSSIDSGQRHFTSPLLFHPVPNRPAKLQLLCSHSVDSDNADSTVAQIGIQSPLISSAQLEENEAWRAFVTGPAGNKTTTDPSDFGGEKVMFETLVSPGLSQLGQTKLNTDYREEPTHALMLGIDEMNEEMGNGSLVHTLGESKMPLDGCQIDSAQEVLSPEAMNMAAAQVFGVPHASGQETQGPSPMKSQSSDEVSLLIIPSSPSLSSSPEKSSESTVKTDQATAGSSDASLLTQTDLVDGQMTPTVTETSTTETDNLPLTTQPYKVEKRSQPDEGFMFAPPKLFVGKRLGHVDEQRQIALSNAQIRGRGQPRRRSTRTSDGRANIRKLPNYGSDPIEEFEEDDRSNRAQQGSIFGSLETEGRF
ncbi:hypothetical protein VPNG_06925 [Cytospora leucostoma]|uniref:Uncharacterized protein n=1 Tax=Cytospora leucostoma TaxID=1230097 RepID=A0A423WXG1_9PEZI|nr:hypothetical protein VPNG_06925 [Cytospora leucostoma]